MTADSFIDLAGMITLVLLAYFLIMFSGKLFKHAWDAVTDYETAAGIAMGVIAAVMVAVGVLLAWPVVIQVFEGWAKA